MRKSRIKKINVLLLILLISFNSFASIVSDSDGSAFVSKSEFEALKEGFSSQVANYNKSLDNRIDGAVSTYLKSVILTSDPQNLFEKYVNSTGKKPTFLNNYVGTGSATNSSEININVLREQVIKAFTNMYFAQSLWIRWNDYTTWDSVLYFNSAPDWGGSYSSWTTVWKRFVVSLNTAGASGDLAHPLTSWSHWNSSTTQNSGNKTYQAVSNNITAGSGSAWIYQEIDGNKMLKYYDTKIYPKFDISAVGHRYKNCASLTDSYYLSDGGKGDTTTISLSLNKTTSYGNTTQGTRVASGAESNATYADISISKLEANNGINYTDYIFAKNPTQEIYCIDEEAALIASNTQQTLTTSTTYFYDVYYTGIGANPQKNEMSGITLKYYPLSYAVTKYKVHDFYNYNVTLAAGEVVKNGEGFPILESTSLDTDCEVKIKFKSTSGNIQYKISDKKLIDDAFDSTANVKLSGTVASDAVVTANFTDLASGQKVWVNCYSATSGARANIESVEITVR